MTLNAYIGKVLVAGCLVLVFQVTAEGQGPTVQALLGVVRHDGLEVERSDGTDTVTIDVSSMPQFGGAWATAPKGENLQLGLECSFLLGFDLGSENYSLSSTKYVNIDYDIWNFDLAGGLYANLLLGQQERVRMYVASGPMITTTLFHSQSYVNNSNGDDQYRRSSESAFGYGLYARTGIEFRIHEPGMLGVGVRGTWVDTDLSSVNDFTGIAAFVTYSADL